MTSDLDVLFFSIGRKNLLSLPVRGARISPAEDGRSLRPSSHAKKLSITITPPTRFFTKRVGGAPEKSWFCEMFGVPLFFALRHGNCHSDSRADHGVVAHAQKAHHFHGRNRLWRFLNWGTRVPEEVSLSFLNARHTSIFIAWYAFFIGGILSYHLFRKPDV